MTDVLCTICARGGSTGVPRKNVRTVGGKPLIVHSVEHAKSWERTTDVVVSTDDEEIRDVATAHGAQAPFVRPDELASDEAAKLPAIKHAVREMESRTGTTYDYVVDLDATAPLRNVEDIERCYDVATQDDVSNSYTVTEADKNPYFNMVELDREGYAQLSKEPSTAVVRRQDTPTVYAMNASVYVYEHDFLLETDSVHGERTKVSVMPPERSIDIDRPVDLEFVDFLMNNDHA